MRPISGIVETTRYWRPLDLAEECDQPDITLSAFVSIGTGAGGAPFGFVTDRLERGAIHALDGEAGIFREGSYRPEAYLRHYFGALSSFSQ